MDRFDYFYGVEAEQYSFFRMPKILFQDKKFAGISCEAKLLYGIMLDRMALSRKNGWLDENERVYIIFTVDEIMEMLNCSKPTAIKILAELDTGSGVGLIEKHRKRFNCPSRIYVKNFIRLAYASEDVEEKQESNLQDESERVEKKEMLKLKNLTSEKGNMLIPETEVKNFNHEEENRGKEILLQEKSRSQKILPLEVKKFDSINTNKSNTDSVTSNLSINPNNNVAGKEDADRWRDKIREKIDYPCLCVDYKKSINQIDELVELMVETFMTKSGQIRISGEFYETRFVQSRLNKIDMTHIQYVLDCLEKNSSEIRNIKSYLLTALFNAPITINNFYQQKVNADYMKSK